MKSHDLIKALSQWMAAELCESAADGSAQR